MEINKKKNVMGNFLLVLMLVMLICPLINAVALTGDYIAGSPAKIAPGETKEIVFRRMQNTGDSDITVELEILEGSEIASLVGESSVVVLAGTLDSEIRLSISIPADVVEGTEYSVAIRVKELAPDGDDMVSMTKSKVSSIPVLVEKHSTQETPGEGISTTWWILGILLVVIIIALVWFFVKSKKESPGKVSTPVKSIK